MNLAILALVLMVAIVLAFSRRSKVANPDEAQNKTASLEDFNRQRLLENESELEELESSGNYPKLLARLEEIGNLKKASYVAQVMRDYVKLEQLVNRRIKNGEQPKDYLYDYFYLLQKVSGKKAVEKEARRYLSSSSELEVISLCLDELHSLRRYSLVQSLANELVPAISSADKIVKIVENVKKARLSEAKRESENRQIIASDSSAFREKLRASIQLVLLGERDDAESFLNSAHPSPNNREEQFTYLNTWSAMHLLENEYKKAEEVLLQMVDLEPSDYSYGLLEHALHSQGRYKEAHQYLMLQSDKREPTKHPSPRADLKAANGEAQEALELYQEELKNIWESERKYNPKVKSIGMRWELWRSYELKKQLGIDS